MDRSSWKTDINFPSKPSEISFDASSHRSESFREPFARDTASRVANRKEITNLKSGLKFQLQVSITSSGTIRSNPKDKQPRTK